MDELAMIPDVPVLHAVSSFQSQNIYFNSDTSSLNWKSKLRNVWGQFYIAGMF